MLPTQSYAFCMAIGESELFQFGEAEAKTSTPQSPSSPSSPQLEEGEEWEHFGGIGTLQKSHSAPCEELQSHTVSPEDAERAQQEASEILRRFGPGTPLRQVRPTQSAPPALQGMPFALPPVTNIKKSHSTFFHSKKSIQKQTRNASSTSIKGKVHYSESLINDDINNISLAALNISRQSKSKKNVRITPK
jgi:hypothetical protein